jgi:hypothetical protein
VLSAKALTIVYVQQCAAIAALHDVVGNHAIAPRMGGATSLAGLYPFAPPASAPTDVEAPRSVLWRQ